MSLAFSISPASDVPIFRQILQQMHQAVAVGRLQVGEQLPAVRVLAEELVINPNTVARAYQELIREGSLESRSGRGVFVAERRQVFLRGGTRPAPAARRRAALPRGHLARRRPAGGSRHARREMEGTPARSPRHRNIRGKEKEMNACTRHRNRSSHQILRHARNRARPEPESSGRFDLRLPGPQRHGEDHDDPHPARAGGSDARAARVFSARTRRT